MHTKFKRINKRHFDTSILCYCLQEILGGNDLWQELEPLPVLSDELSGDVTGLKSGIDYEVRVVLLDRDGSSYQDSDVPYANVTTLCIG
jgi:hypothetical protein